VRGLYLPVMVFKDAFLVYSMQHFWDVCVGIHRISSQCGQSEKKMKRAV
jgi:hypothetical protein